LRGTGSAFKVFLFMFGGSPSCISVILRVNWLFFRVQSKYSVRIIALQTIVDCSFAELLLLSPGQN
jgi:hypothetical protein